VSCNGGGGVQTTGGGGGAGGGGAACADKAGAAAGAIGGGGGTGATGGGGAAFWARAEWDSKHNNDTATSDIGSFFTLAASFWRRTLLVQCYIRVTIAGQFTGRRHAVAGGSGRGERPRPAP
jgi:hypothetical protein